MHSQKPLGLNGVIKMDIRKQLEDFKQIVKAPPIENPRKEGPRFPNDNLSDDEYEKLFEKKVDRKIKSAGPSDKIVVIFADHLKMSKGKLLEILPKFYTPEMGYPKITGGGMGSAPDVVRLYLE